MAAEEAEIMAAATEVSGTPSSSTQIIAELGGLRWEKYQGFWFNTRCLPGVKTLQKEFQPRPDDIYLVSVVKSGTTWTKALLNTILAVTYCGDGDGKSMNNRLASVDEKGPHALVPTIEVDLFRTIDSQNDLSIFSNLPSPRLLHTHVPFDTLPPALKSSPRCKIVYIARNPRDVFVSLWKFWNNPRLEWFQADADLSKETSFDAFCSGVFHGGPFAENVLSYWRESRRNPNKVMFLTYEELQADCVCCVKRLGAFLGCSPPLVEEQAQRIVDKCSFDNLSNLEVNKGRNSIYFREGKVGEWKKHFTTEMQERVHTEIEQKLNDEELHFAYSTTHDAEV